MTRLRCSIAICITMTGCGDVASSTPPPSSGVAQPAPAPAPTPTPSATTGLAPLTGDIAPAHDPAIIKQGDTYFTFVTGHVADREGILAMRTSTDLVNWTYRGPAYRALPAWATAAVPGTAGLWAPDIVRRNGEYRLYYSVSTFGSNRSAIGMATAATLDPANPASAWTDKGVVFQSNTSDDFNAIDPNVFDDAAGRQWMAFGSFWSGIRMIELEPATGMRKAGDTQIRSLASRPSPTAIEAPFVIRRGGFYYLFASIDFCCRGSDSSYSTIVGRSAEPTGPYVDREGRAMMQGGGTEVLASGRGTTSRFVGRGHVSILQDGTRDYIVYHAYDTQRNGVPTLQVQPIAWTADGWPVAQ